MSINLPPEFMNAKPVYLKGEGYWSNKEGKVYMPKICDSIWEDKDKFIETVYQINYYLVRKGKYIQYLGYAHSRITSEKVGSNEYCDNEYDMIWPQNYVEHYIKNHNVMPTERFYNYVIKRVATLPELVSKDKLIFK